MKRKLLTTLLTLCCLLQSTVAWSAEAGRLRVAYAAPSTTYLPLWAAKEARFFDKHKLPVELVFIGSSPIALSALFAGEIDILAGGGTVAPTVHLEGNRDIALFAAMNNKFLFAIYSRPEITTADGLRSRRLGVTRFGGTMDFSTRYFLKQSGIDPRKDVKLVQIGRVPDILGALVAGSIDAGTMAFPYDRQARKLGYHEIADLSELKVRYASTAFVAKRSFLAKQSERVTSFIKAITEAIQYVKANREEAIKILARHTRTNDMEVLGATYDFHSGKVWPRVPEIQPEDLKLILEQLTQRNPKAAEIDPSDLIYDRIIKEVVDSGFVDQLYGKK